MPFAIWCATCPRETIIGQGVRFNAEKKKVGNYYSSPIYSFRMKHTACGGWIEIRTDPKSTAYVVTEGAKKRDIGDDRIHEGDVQLRTDEEKERLRNDAFAALEVTIDDRKQATADKTRIDDLLQVKDKDWDDPYSANRNLRKAFRVERKLREKNEAKAEDLKNRMSLGIDLLEESELDSRRAALVDFGEAAVVGDEVVMHKVHSKALFTKPDRHASPSPLKVQTKKPNAEIEADASRARLRRELGQNTRIAKDPFLSTNPSVGPPSIKGIKRKRQEGLEATVDGSAEAPKSDVTSVTSLVDYASD